MANKFWKITVLSFVVALSLSTSALAADSSVLPSTTISTSDCKSVMNYVHSHSSDIRKAFKDRIVVDISVGDTNATLTSILGCGIKTGNISLWMIPYYIRYILEFVIQIGGLVGVGGIIYGGYLYLFAGVSEDKDKGKKALIYSLSGIVLTLVAWAFVNIIIAIVTA